MSYTYIGLTDEQVERIVEEQVKREYMLPELNDQELRRLYHRMKPIMSKSEGYSKYEDAKYVLKGFHVDHLKGSYIYCVCGNHNKQPLIQMMEMPMREEIRISQGIIRPVDEFFCVKKFKYDDFFMLSISDILRQVPKDMLEKANAFELVDFPRTMSDVWLYPEITERGYHLARIKTWKIEK